MSVEELERLRELVLQLHTYRAPEYLESADSDANAALATIDRLAERERWIPVGERLPEPGRIVLVYGFNELGKLRRLRAQYAGENTLPLGDGEWFEGCTADEDGAEYCALGWYETNEYEDTHWLIEFPVLGWRELPAVPSGCDAK